MKHLFATLLAAAALGGAASAQMNDPLFNPDGTLNKVGNIGIAQKLGADIPMDATFKDETGQTVRLSQYFGRRPVVLSLIFYKCPGMCNLEYEGLVDSFTKMSRPGPNHALIGKDVDVLSVSIDPNETPADAAAKKKLIMQEFDYPSAAQGWHFLTGDAANINKLATAVGYSFTYNKLTKGINHPVGIMLATPAGTVSQYFYGTGYPEKPFKEAIALAGKNQVGPRAQVFLLGCLCRDALTGKYTVNAWKVLQLLCVLTVVSLVGGIYVMSVRARRRGPLGI